jgi:hypothetical protein
LDRMFRQAEQDDATRARIRASWPDGFAACGCQKVVRWLWAGGSSAAKRRG